MITETKRRGRPKKVQQQQPVEAKQVVKKEKQIVQKNVLNSNTDRVHIRFSKLDYKIENMKQLFIIYNIVLVSILVSCCILFYGN